MTPQRFRTLKAALDRRQPDLTVLLEQVHKGHNLSAIVRTCDAVGVFEAHAVPLPGYEERPPRNTSSAAGGTGRWVGVRSHDSVDAALDHLEERGFQVLAAHLSERAVDFRAVDYTRPTALLLGQEKDGVTAPAAARAGGHIRIPMMGLVASLNVSVAAAVILFEAQRQRAAAGLYENCRLRPEVYHRALFEWAYPRLAALCRRRGAPYPRLGEDGELLDPVPR